MFEDVNKQEEVQGEPEDGDIYCSRDGSHIGTVDQRWLNGSIAEALHLQILHDGEWYCYQLVSVESHPKEQGEDRVTRTDQASGD